VDTNNRITQLHSKAIIQIGSLARNKFNPQGQFAIIKEAKNRIHFVVGGFLDHSFRIISEEDLDSFEVAFHKKSVSCVHYLPEDGIIVSGSRDSRVAFWSKADCMVKGKKPRPIQVFHAHYDEVVCMVSNSNLGVVVSSDKANYVCVHDIFRPRILTTFSLAFGLESPESVIKRLFLSEVGYLLAGSISQYFVCSLSGEVLRSFEANYANFLDPFALKIVTILQISLFLTPELFLRESRSFSGRMLT
jgi:WD40 repeat protein